MKKLGMKTEKAPADRPKINLPTHTTYKFRISVMPHPMHSITLLSRMHFLLPYFINGPENSAPTADPRVHIAEMSPFNLSCSFLSLIYRTIIKSVFKELKTPFEKPKVTAPMPIVRMNEIRYPLLIPSTGTISSISYIL